MTEQSDLVHDVSYADVVRDEHWSLIRLVTRAEPPNPYEYPRSDIGLTLYLRQCGIEHFCGREVSQVARPSALDTRLAVDLPRSSGTPDEPLLLPARAAWPRLACVLHIAESLRAIAGPLEVLHWWRPGSYNAAVSNANEKPGSDHVTASAVDLMARDGARLDAAVEAVIDPIWLADRTDMVRGISIGHRRGSLKIHIGVWAPATRAKGAPRRWSYDPATGAEVAYR